MDALPDALRVDTGILWYKRDRAVSFSSSIQQQLGLTSGSEDLAPSRIADCVCMELRRHNLCMYSTLTVATRQRCVLLEGLWTEL